MSRYLRPECRPHRGPYGRSADIARIALDAIAANEVEIVGDEMSTQVRSGLSGGVAALYPNSCEPHDPNFVASTSPGDDEQTTETNIKR